MQSQEEIELECYQFGRDRMAKSIDSNEDKGRAHNNPYAQAVYRRFILPLAKLIREDIEHKRVGRRQAHVKLLEPLDPDGVAFIAVRTMLSGLLSKKDFGSNGRNIVAELGRSVYHEYMLTHFEHIEPELFFTLVNDFDRRQTKNERHKMTVFKQQAKKNNINWNQWSAGDRDQVGAYLVEQLSVLGMVKARSVVVNNSNKYNIRHRIEVELTDEVCELVEKISDHMIEIAPFFAPCVEPPKDWVSISDGGFHTKEMRRMMPYVVKMHPSQREHYLNADLTTELEAVNILQRVEWRVNTKMLDAVKEVSRHFDMDEILSQAERPKPDKPEWLAEGMTKEMMTEAQLDEFVAWKHKLADWHTERKLRGTKLGRFKNAMWIASKYRDYEKIWFVYFIDFRGRKYVQTTGITPQGSDLQKSLIEFAEGKPLSTPEAVQWFKIAGANRWGYDKCSLAEQVAWVDERAELIRAFASDPISNTGWMEADCPLQFLAWCMEFDAWSKDKSFSSHLACGMDGSCNGLQNFSAMLRDEVGGAATNLIPSSSPNDIYGMVAVRTSLRLGEMEADERGFRKRWLSVGITRSLVKRSVMTLPYGSTRFSCAEFLVEDHLKRNEFPCFEQNEWSHAANFLSFPVWDSIGDVVVKAREAMEWLQKAARQLIKEGHDEIHWTTPSGFPVFQTYWKAETYQIRTRVLGGTLLKVRQEVDTPDANKHKNGIAPNFVHSHDATHLTLTVRAAAARGIKSFAMIHDDFGTHAADAQELYHLIRSEFVAMYERVDPLMRFAEEYPQLPEPPAKGNLDIRQVLDSPYFFR